MYCINLCKVLNFCSVSCCIVLTTEKSSIWIIHLPCERKKNCCLIKLFLDVVDLWQQDRNMKIYRTLLSEFYSNIVAKKRDILGEGSCWSWCVSMDWACFSVNTTSTGCLLSWCSERCANLTYVPFISLPLGLTAVSITPATTSIFLNNTVINITSQFVQVESQFAMFWMAGLCQDRSDKQVIFVGNSSFL